MGFKISDLWTDATGSFDPAKAATSAAGAAAIYGVLNPDSGIGQFIGAGSNQQPVGYTGGIPEYTLSRSLQPNAFTTTTGQVDPTTGAPIARRPGSMGRSYFTPTTYTPTGSTMTAGTPTPAATPGTTSGILNALPEEAITALLASIYGGGVGGTTPTSTSTPTPTPTPTRTTTTSSPSGMTNQTGTAADTAWMDKSRSFTEDQWQNVFDAWAAQNPDATLSQIGSALDEFNVPVSMFDEAFGMYPNLEVTRTTTTSSPSGMTNQTGTAADTEWMEQSKNFTEDQWKNIIQAWAAQNPDATPAQIQSAAKEFGVPSSLYEYAGSLFPNYTFKYAGGGLASLGGRGYYLGGSTDGMADQVPASIDNREPAALSDGEFVIPADVVSHLGNGNSNAGAQELYAMMDKIRKARTGTTAQGTQINPRNYLPA